MTREFRTDRGTLQRPRRTADGLLVEGHAARVHRVGDGLRYPTGEEYRDLAELRRIVDQLVGTPVTYKHPKGMISEDPRARVVGRVDAAWLDGEHAAVRILVDDEQAIEEIYNEATNEIVDDARELSLGYETELDRTRHQRDTDIDHLALVEMARCGSSCALRADALSVEKPGCACGGSREIDRPHAHAHREGSIAPLEKSNMADNEEKKLDEQLAELKGQLDAITKERDELKAKLGEKMAADEAEAVKKEKDRADGLQTRLDSMNRDIPALVRARVALERTAVAAMGEGYRLDGKDDDEIVREVVKRLDSSIDVKATPMPELRGHFKQLVSRHAAAKKSYADAGEILAGRRNDGAAKRDADAKVKHDWDNQHLKTLNKGARQ